ncbi:HAMP domain-containing protein [Stappia taiwanensis]|uniref:histidine kinase n=1 Tax=Stappia taiwanensis TaxID=992267 RepID=A0A838XV12_9HYPH|nr:ATP-binding protein [Stappia taiwanensis]MBA4610823.1 HAMP domain-containing protein [Stappia taiwanensis]GGE95583.1 two-component sensor histidine kinase [Stappia taiwanensis]
MTNWRLSLWPRSLAGQLIALLLIALVVAQCFTLWIFAGERRVALVEMARSTFLARGASLVRVLEEAPQSQYPEILKAVSSHFLWFQVNSKPALAASGTRPAERRLVEMFREELGDDRDIRIDVMAKPPSSIRHPRATERRAQRRDTEARERRDRRRRTGIIALAMSVPLKDGQWLNAATRFRLPRHTYLPMLVSIGLMAGAIVLIIAVTIRRLTRPLRELAAAADKLGRGEDVDPLPETGPAEVRGTIQAFNVMQDRLTRFVRDRTRMLGAISHDLRTPITSLRIRAEFIEDDENREKMIETLDEMQHMVEATLALARDQSSREAAAKTDLGEFVDAIADDYRSTGRPVTFERPAARIVTTIRPISLKRALRNLIDNAIRYGGSADLSLEERPDSLVLSVRDSGPGIPPERLKDVFDPFVRIEESRSEETGGIGLGLSIARSIVHAHGGTLTLGNRQEGGLLARISLPRCAAS